MPDVKMRHTVVLHDGLYIFGVGNSQTKAGQQFICEIFLS